MDWRSCGLRCAVLAAATLCGAAAPPDLESALRAARYELDMDQGHFAGPAAPVLSSAIASAQFVLIGEDHLTREIPQFTAAVCDDMTPLGLTAMAVEAGPQAARFVSAAVNAPGYPWQISLQIRTYPDSIAFLNMRDEADLVEHCARAAGPGHFRLWGLDQEFLGAADWLLDQALAEPLSAPAKMDIERLRAISAADTKSAAASGDPGRLFMLSATAEYLHDAAAALRTLSDRRAAPLLQALIISHTIYAGQGTNASYSNRQRSLLMKQTLVADMQAAGVPARQQRVLFKFGEFHLYRGLNPRHQLDLGNFVSELADGQGTSSLHICVLGVGGTHREYGGYLRPTKLQPFHLLDDDDYHWLKPAVDNVLPAGWTVYDLRKLRFHHLFAAAPDMDRLAFGYDFLVLIPRLTPASPL